MKNPKINNCFLAQKMTKNLAKWHLLRYSSAGNDDRLSMADSWIDKFSFNSLVT
jgi:hypothetical protein